MVSFVLSYALRMSRVLDELVKLLALERLEENLFRGQSQDLGWGTVFGGQVLGQAVSAAAHTVDPERRVHSVQSYFLRPGDVNKPIVYEVDRIRDGGSFTTRRVIAIQSGHVIFNLAASFQKLEEGFSHQEQMPDAPAPETVATEQEKLLQFGDRVPPFIRTRASGARPFELRPVQFTDDPFAPEPGAPERMVWIKASAALPDTPALHSGLLAYVSDYAFLTTALLPHGVGWLTPGMHMASLDHIMWFHAPFRVDSWLLHVIRSPRAHGARGFVRGSVFSQDGVLVASTAQEGLIRKLAKKSSP
jgi:acyl-CoA thioesterase II